MKSMMMETSKLSIQFLFSNLVGRETTCFVCLWLLPSGKLDDREDGYIVGNQTKISVTHHLVLGTTNIVHLKREVPIYRSNLRIRLKYPQSVPSFSGKLITGRTCVHIYFDILYLVTMTYSIFLPSNKAVRHEISRSEIWNNSRRTEYWYSLCKYCQREIDEGSFGPWDIYLRVHVQERKLLFFI